MLATTSEISLKRLNRRWFECTLTENVRTALSGLPVGGLEQSEIIGLSRRIAESAPWREIPVPGGVAS